MVMLTPSASSEMIFVRLLDVVVPGVTCGRCVRKLSGTKMHFAVAFSDFRTLLKDRGMRL